MTKQNSSPVLGSSNPSQDKSSTLREQVNTLELKVAYHERLNQDLSDQVYHLHKEIDLLKAQVQTLKEQIQQGNKSQLNIGPADESPPHY